MRKAIIILLLIIVLLVPIAFAQLDWNVTDLRCGNEKLDTFELCEKDVEEGYCGDLGELLSIATACDDAHCTCVPRVNKAFCNNGNREGVEACDGDEDYCPQLGQKIGLDLECNRETCGCNIVGGVPEGYDPSYIEHLENLTQQPAVCGNKELEGSEECDPEGVLCTTVLDEPGTCSSSCTCVVAEESQVAENVTIDNETVELEEPLNETVEVEPEKAGFFKKIWRWFASLFE